MTRLSAELPMATGVVVFKSLSDAADPARAQGDSRSRGQVMADALAQRVLGTASGAWVPVEIELVVSPGPTTAIGPCRRSAYDSPCTGCRQVSSSFSATSRAVPKLGETAAEPRDLVAEQLVRPDPTHRARRIRRR